AITPCTASVSGANLSLTPTPSYSSNVHAGTATASYSYAGDANHAASSDSKDFSIARANVTCSVTGYDVVYDGSAHTAAGTCAGVGSDTAVAGLGLDATTHTNVGTYNDTWTFTANVDYNGTSGSVTDKVSAASSSITVTCPATPQTYTGL